MSAEPVNPLLAFLRRRWPLLGLAGVLSASAAVALAPRWSSTTYACNAVLYYTRTALGAPHYQQPEVQSIGALARSRPVVEATAADFGGPALAKPIADSVTVEIPPGSQAVQLTMRGGDPEQTRLRLDRLARAVVEQAAAIRRRTIEAVLENQRQRLAEARDALRAAQADLAEFHAMHGVLTTVAADLERLRDDVATIELSVGTERTAATDPEDDLRRRRTTIQERLAYERDAAARATELELKREEHRRAQRLHEKRYLSDAEFQRIALQLRSLETQHEQERTRWQGRLAEIDAALQAGDDEPARGRTDDREADSILRRNAFLAERRAEIERLNALRADALRLEQAVATAQAEVTRLVGLTNSYEELRSPNFRELTIVQPAAPTLYPATSTKKKVFAGLFAGLCTALMLPIAAWDGWSLLRRRRNSNSLAGLPVLASVEPRDGVAPIERSEAVRTAALRIQQSAPDAATVVLVQPLDDGAAAAAADIAVCLTKRGEKTVVVELSPDHGEVLAAHFAAADDDASPASVLADWVGPAHVAAPVPAGSVASSSASGPAAVLAVAPLGLTEWIGDVDLTLDDVVRRGRMFDWISPGPAPAAAEACAHPRLSDLIDRLRRSHTVVLLVGPKISASVDVELSAARADSVLFTATAGREVSAVAESTLAELRRRRVPTLGLLVLEA